MDLSDGAALVQILRQYPEARMIVCGHVHMDHMVQHDGLTMCTTPSTCFQLSKLGGTDRPALPGPPAFRLFWVKGPEVSTRVVHLHQGEMVAG